MAKIFHVQQKSGKAPILPLICTGKLAGQRFSVILLGQTHNSPTPCTFKRLRKTIVTVEALDCACFDGNNDGKTYSKPFFKNRSKVSIISRCWDSSAWV